MRGGVLSCLTISLAVACVNEPALNDSAPSPVVRVQAHRVTRRTVRSWVYGQGTVEAVHRKALSFETDGRVAYVAESVAGRPLQVGDHVRGPAPGETHGQLLMSLDNRERAAAVAASEAALRQTHGEHVAGNADVESARIELDRASAEYDRLEALVAANATSLAAVDDARSRLERATSALERAKALSSSSRNGTSAQRAELERARIGLEKGSIFAPFDGVVAFVNVDEGDYFSTSSLSGSDEAQRLDLAPIVVIDPSEFEVSMQLPAFEADEIAVGQAAFVVSGTQLAPSSNSEPSSFDDELAPVLAEVYAVSPAVDPRSRTVEVKLRTTVEDPRLRDGAFVGAWIITNTSEDTIFAPYDAIVRGDDGPRAFVINAHDMTVEAHELSFGLRGMLGVEVREGLAVGDYVVTEGRHALVDGSVVEVRR